MVLLSGILHSLVWCETVKPFKVLAYSKSLDVSKIYILRTGNVLLEIIELVLLEREIQVLMQIFISYSKFIKHVWQVS